MRITKVVTLPENKVEATIQMSHQQLDYIVSVGLGNLIAAGASLFGQASGDGDDDFIDLNPDDVVVVPPESAAKETSDETAT